MTRPELTDLHKRLFDILKKSERTLKHDADGVLLEPIIVALMSVIEHLHGQLPARDLST